MIDDEKSAADGPGEAVLDEPTAHALDPEADPNNEWEQKAVDQLEGGSSGADEAEAEEDGDTADPGTPEGTEEPS